MSAFLQVFLISVSLAMDALSVSVAGGIKTQKAKLIDAAKIATFFGGFQALMPIAGWYIGMYVKDSIDRFDHWIAFSLLSGIGIKMIMEAFGSKDKETGSMLQTKTLILLSIATSIDAFIVGITLGFIDVPLLLSVTCIGLVTFVLCFIGFLFGKKLGSFFEGKVEIIGGLLLIGIGVKILLENLIF